MKTLYKKTLFCLFLVICNYSFAQENCIKILDVNEIKYYYVYKAVNVYENDTITILSSKLDKEFKIIKLEKNNFYEVKTRLKSAIKISDEKYIFCKPVINKIEDTQISDENKLPVLILDYKNVDICSDKE